MRRLPIFFLVDVSESMAGENLYKLEKGLGAVVSALRKDPYALETAWLSVMVFAGRTRVSVPLTELTLFQTPELPIGGGTALGAALDRLMDEIDRTVTVSTPDRKGDWRPIVFLLTDGHPTDDASAAVARWNRAYRSRAHLVAVSIGGGADHELLKRLTEDVVVFNDQAPDAFSRFIGWVTLSIQSQSRSVSAGEEGKLSLAKGEADLLARPGPSARRGEEAGVDDRFAVFVGRCVSTKLPYLVKYERQYREADTQDPVLARALRKKFYLLKTTLPLKASYFDLCAEGEGAHPAVKVNSMDLVGGQPPCPHCLSPISMAMHGAGCGGLHCLRGEGEATCPWCGALGFYGASEGGMEIGRGRG
ncbi:TerY-C metal binding domain-containing protein [Neomegalonema sp.]|uniref:TerY-C metal binding domain-containing protein n=1 Tax=Neomegalonema sp. TaxID=2039713 RepID=UPI0026148B4E|nr:TerY-C metal binding domain-containing protein [Neomegalonema sp.]MDD2867778.1 TerY-C metal binding domain-containing protein [Neomegalonema sp.]